MQEPPCRVWAPRRLYTSSRTVQLSYVSAMCCGTFGGDLILPREASLLSLAQLAATTLEGFLPGVRTGICVPCHAGTKPYQLTSTVQDTFSSSFAERYLIQRLLNCSRNHKKMFAASVRLPTGITNIGRMQSDTNCTYPVQGCPSPCLFLRLLYASWSIPPASHMHAA